MTENTESITPNTTNRPLSPHLSIYKPQLTSILSITHRITGVILAAGLVALVAWLWALAYCETAVLWWEAHHEAPWFNALLMAWTLAFFYHMLNGIRHLGWDVGSGFSLPAAYRTGWLVVAGTIALTALVWFPFLSDTFNL